jgi:hypothetical protein
MMEEFKKKTMRVEEFAKEYDMNLTRAYEVARRPGFPSIRIGKRLVVLRDGLDQWIENEILKDKSKAS